MKTRLLLLILALCSASCQDNAFLPSQELIQTRAVVDKNNISISNPELITNWENLKEITLNTIGTSTINKRVSTCFLDAAYGDKLGAVYERFDDRDIRKKNY